MKTPAEHTEAMDRDTNGNVIEYRVARLEEAMANASSAISTLRDILMKWDAKFSQTEGFLQCPMHKMRLDEVSVKVTALEEIVKELDRWKWKATGVLSAVMVIVQLCGSVVTEKLFKHEIRTVYAGTNLVAHTP